ncbi:MAG: L-ribulose-5-phosphate 4-epimerase [Armatimonadota bacterium]|nr:L-ribulose-5-phosphate 4-epimerase [Armatimonadota bacterium]MDR7558645.1 L-ribulose-5-phosphate 4-epimerase [Armatimonadota bacterium]
MLAALREEVYAMHLELVRWGLVSWTSGNVSGRDPDSGLVVIKPSGVRYEELRPDLLVVVNADGQTVEGTLAPSVDTATHLFLYRRLPRIGGVVHTHSPYATAFAALKRAIPVYLTSMADVFGGPIPCAEYAPVGTEAIGEAAVRFLHSSPVVLLAHHGVLAVGETPTAATRAAVLTEDAARICYLALQMGKPEELPADEVRRAYEFHRSRYGQRNAEAHR